MSGAASAGVFVDADGRTDAYLLLHEGNLIYEVPDCAHSKFGPHITQQYDDELQEHVFAFHLHTAFDNDRCMVFDRQRTEIATFHAKALEGDTRTYQWRFKLDEHFVPSTYFNHIFQIRPIDPVPGGNPVFTISLNEEELLFYQDTGSGMRVLHRVPLADFKGQWIDARVRAKFSPSGFIEVELASTLDKVVLLEWRQEPINLWPWDEIRFTLPKWGNYRSLETTQPLRDETVLYNDFCVAEEGETCEELEMLDKFGITPVAYSLPDQIRIDPFPTGRLFGSGLLHSLRQALGAQPEEQSATAFTSERPDIKPDGEEPVKAMPPIMRCKAVSKFSDVSNPFARSTDCPTSWSRSLQN